MQRAHINVLVRIFEVEYRDIEALKIAVLFPLSVQE